MDGNLKPDARVISASRRSDLPAFHGRWFEERLAEGCCDVAHPFTGQLRRVSLRREDVAGWLFWSRNYRPFLTTLQQIHGDAQRFLCQFTINGFPRSLEPRVPSTAAAVETARRLRDAFGPVVLWRYDPILLTDATPPAWHEAQFALLAGAMASATDVCTVSIPTIYRKTERNMARAARRDPSARLWKPGADFSKSDLGALLETLAGVARAHGKRFQVCCGPERLNALVGIEQASCMDWPRLRGLLEEDGLPIPPTQPRRRATRKGCACYASTDIGRYNSCAHGCAYCYAVDDPEAVQLDHGPDAGR